MRCIMVTFLLCVATAASATRIEFSRYNVNVKCLSGWLLCEAFPIRGVTCDLLHHQSDLKCHIWSLPTSDHIVDYHIADSYCFTDQAESCQIEYYIVIQNGWWVFWQLLSFQCAALLHTLAVASLQLFDVASQYARRLLTWFYG